MLSIDVTDKQVRIVRGSISGTRIRVIQVETRELPTGCIQNGFVTDIPMLASEIVEVLRTQDIKDKDAIICINSSLILYKELALPKPKNISNSFVIETMIQNNMNITSEYNISYTITGETKDENENPMIKIMATACPQRMVDGYIRLFSHLGLNLKQVNVSNNCITRLITNTNKFSTMMPLLLVQVDEDFLNINLYDDNKIVISRYVKIDKADYNYDDDYVSQAVYDNIFHMMQFIESRPDAKPVKEIMFYGHIPDFIPLTNAIASFNVSSHILSAPSNVVVFCEMNFAEYANAIGAFFHARKDFDHVNLLQSTAAKEKKSVGSYPFILIALLLGAAAIVAVPTILFKTISNDYDKQTAAIATEIGSPELVARVAELNVKIAQEAKIQQYNSGVLLAEDIFQYSPKVYSEVIDKLEENLVDGLKIVGSIEVYGYNVTVYYTAENREQSAAYVEALRKQDYFENIVYSGFDGSEEEKQYEFTLTMLLKGGNAIETK